VHHIVIATSGATRQSKVQSAKVQSAKVQSAKIQSAKVQSATVPLDCFAPLAMTDRMPVIEGGCDDQISRLATLSAFS
jgi:hypothetical protein